jgi:hypothetical protein
MYRIFVLAAAVTAAVSLSSGAFAQGKKGKATCSVETCMSQCAKVGGQPRKCGDYCSKQISSRKAAGQC